MADSWAFVRSPRESRCWRLEFIMELSHPSSLEFGERASSFGGELIHRPEQAARARWSPFSSTSPQGSGMDRDRHVNEDCKRGVHRCILPERRGVKFLRRIRRPPRRLFPAYSGRRISTTCVMASLISKHEATAPSKIYNTPSRSEEPRK